MKGFQCNRCRFAMKAKKRPSRCPYCGHIEPILAATRKGPQEVKPKDPAYRFRVVIENPNAGVMHGQSEP